jgi:hypothetical protein
MMIRRHCQFLLRNTGSYNNYMYQNSYYGTSTAQSTTRLMSTGSSSTTIPPTTTNRSFSTTSTTDTTEPFIVPIELVSDTM